MTHIYPSLRLKFKTPVNDSTIPALWGSWEGRDITQTASSLEKESRLKMLMNLLQINNAEV
jgi:hypothetical protein